MFNKRRLQRMIVTGFAVGVAALGGVMASPSAAQAGTASCTASLSYNTAYGGCTHYGYASRRMWATCQVIGSHFTWSRATPWHWGSNLCWGDQVACGTGTRVTKAWFEVGQ